MQTDHALPQWVGRALPLHRWVKCWLEHWVGSGENCWTSERHASGKAGDYDFLCSSGLLISITSRSTASSTPVALAQALPEKIQFPFDLVWQESLPLSKGPFQEISVLQWCFSLFYFLLFAAKTVHTYAEGLASLLGTSPADRSRPCYFRCTEPNEHARCVRQPENSSSAASRPSVVDDNQSQTLLHSPSSSHIFAASSSISSNENGGNSSSSSSTSFSSSVTSSSATSSVHTGGAAILSVARAPWTRLGFVARLLALWIIRTLLCHMDLGLT